MSILGNNLFIDIEKCTTLGECKMKTLETLDGILADHTKLLDMTSSQIVYLKDLISCLEQEKELLVNNVDKLNSYKISISKCEIDDYLTAQVQRKNKLMYLGMIGSNYGTHSRGYLKNLINIVKHNLTKYKNTI